MASTVTWVTKTVFGNKRVFMGTMTATDGTDEVATGLNYIDFGVHSPASVTGATPQCNMVINSTTNGSIKMTTGVSAMVYHVMLVGN
jgi:hypothetical protein